MKQRFSSLPKTLWERPTGSSASTIKQDGKFKFFPMKGSNGLINETEFQTRHSQRDIGNERFPGGQTVPNRQTAIASPKNTHSLVYIRYAQNSSKTIRFLYKYMAITFC